MYNDSERRLARRADAIITHEALHVYAGDDRYIISLSSGDEIKISLAKKGNILMLCCRMSNHLQREMLQ